MHNFALCALTFVTHFFQILTHLKTSDDLIGWYKTAQMIWLVDINAISCFQFLSKSCALLQAFHGLNRASQSNSDLTDYGYNLINNNKQSLMLHLYYHCLYRLPTLKFLLETMMNCFLYNVHTCSLYRI